MTAGPTPCPLCGARENVLVYRASPGFEPKECCFSCTSPQLASHGDIVRCLRCEMVFADPRPDPATLRQAYEQVQDPVYVEETPGREATFAASLRALETLRKPPGKLLDVGCYTGVFMRLAAASGWSVSGLELSAWAAEVARAHTGAPIHQCELAEVPLEPGLLDVVVMWDVIEHLANPGAVLADAYRLLRPGGMLALSTHMLDSVAARVMGRRYPFLMGMHVCHFTCPTLTRLLQEHGFRVGLQRTHERFVLVRYFLERAGRLIGPLRPWLERLAKAQWAARRLVRVRWLGLVEVYAERE